MPMFGVHLYPTAYSMDPVEVVKAAEERGLDSVTYPEHTHIPTSRKTPFPGEGELPKFYAELHDPFIVMAAAASVTRRIKLGTGVCLITEHDPIVLAKQIGSLDVICRGRLFLAIGAGWNAEEMENHGTRLKTRWLVTRERVLAMKRIWSDAEAEFQARLSISIRFGVGPNRSNPVVRPSSSAPPAPNQSSASWISATAGILRGSYQIWNSTGRA